MCRPQTRSGAKRLTGFRRVPVYEPFDRAAVKTSPNTDLMENHFRISRASVFTVLADLAFVSRQGLAMPAVAALSMPNRIQVRRRRCRDGPIHWHTSFVATVRALFSVQPQCFVDQRLGYPKRRYEYAAYS